MGPLLQAIDRLPVEADSACSASWVTPDSTAALHRTTEVVATLLGVAGGKPRSNMAIVTAKVSTESGTSSNGGAKATIDRR